MVLVMQRSEAPGALVVIPPVSIKDRASCGNVVKFERTNHIPVNGPGKPSTFLPTVSSNVT